MPPVYDLHGVTVLHGDCLAVLADLPDASVDSVVTDPPYGLGNPNPDHVIKALERWFAGDRAHVPDSKGFMGRAWDAFVPPPAVWDECLRVLKPGGHMLAFAGSRTYDLMTLSIRLAGFEIRDGLSWLYGSGFPKSLDVGKAIDRARDDNSERQAVGTWLRARREEAGLRQKDVSQHWPSATGGLTGCVANWEHGFNLPTWEQWQKLRDLIGFGDEMDVEVWRLNGRKGTPGEAWGQREVIGERTTGLGTGRGTVAYIGDSDNRDITAPATDDARQWQGWGTALKPAHEPIVMARKPLSGTVAATVTAHGTGALNIEACRVSPTSPVHDEPASEQRSAPGSVPGTWQDAPLRDQGDVLRTPPEQHACSNACTCPDRVSEPFLRSPRTPLEGESATSPERHNGQSPSAQAGARDYSQPQDSPGDCRPSLRSCGGRARSGEAGVPASAPQQLDAHGSPCPGATRERIQPDLSAPYEKYTAPDVQRPGRWPSNVLFTHSPDCAVECSPGCPVAELDAQSGNRPGFASQNDRAKTYGGILGGGGTIGNVAEGRRDGYNDQGGASRFFPVFRYQAKAPTSERSKVKARTKLRLRADLTDEQRAHVLAELTRAGVDVA